MKTMGMGTLRVGLLVSAALLLAGSGLAEEAQDLVKLQRWVREPRVAEPMAMPRTKGDIVVDGKLDEWGSEACVPVKSSTLVSEADRRRRHGGTADASMELWLAWNDEGLCLAGEVKDDELMTSGVERGYPAVDQVDCVQFRIEDRSPKDGTPRRTELTVVAPEEGKPTRFFVNGEDGSGKEVKCATLRTAGGYTFEMMTPWDKGGPSPDGVGIAYLLRDRDATGEDSRGVLEMTHAGVGFRRSGAMMEWQLAQEMPATVNLGVQASIDVPAMFYGDEVALRVDLGEGLARRTGSVRVTVEDAGGKVTEVAMQLEEDASWSGSMVLKGKVGTETLEAGPGTVVARVTDKGGKELGESHKELSVAGPAVVEALAEEMHGVGELAKTEPFKANAYVGAAAALQRFKRLARAGKPEAGFAIEESVARLELLREGSLPPCAPGLLDLLALTRQPESQTVVEYFVWGDEVKAGVSFYCGSIPLVTVAVEEWGSPEQAREKVEGWDRERTWVWSEEDSFEGKPCRVIMHAVEGLALKPVGYDPTRQFILYKKAGRSAYAVDVDQLGLARAEVCCVMEDAEASVKEKVEAWAKERGVGMVDVQEALKSETAVIAGGRAGTESFEGVPMSKAALEEGFQGMKVALGERTYEVHGPSREAAQEAIRMVGACGTVSVEQTDRLSNMMKAELERQVKAAGLNVGRSFTGEDGARGVMVGDVHMHTTYSDGWCSPGEIALRTMYVFMDFISITDHDELEGARLAVKELSAHGVGYPVMVGQEVTTGVVHMNAWPVKTLISNQLPIPEMIEAAHTQGALIQWNHPLSPGGIWQMKTMMSRMEGLAFDAVEHIEDLHHYWSAGSVKVPYISTSDMHGDAFGWSGRALFGMSEFSEENFKRAVREGNVVSVPHYGPEWLCLHGKAGELVGALEDGTGLRAAKAERIRSALTGADVAQLVRDMEVKRGTN